MAQYAIKIKSKGELPDDVSNVVGTDDPKYVTRIVNELKDTLRDNASLVALAAPQIGYAKRVFCMKFANGDVRAFLNPMVLTHGKGMHMSREACAGVAGEWILPRYDEVTAGYQTPMGVPETNAFRGAPGEVFQQMVQLLDGVMIDDYGLEVLEGFDGLSEDDRGKVIDMYLRKLDAEGRGLREEIAADPAMSELDRGIDFLTKVAMGEIRTERLTHEESVEILENAKRKAEGLKGAA